MKKTLIILALTAIALFAMTGTAFANFGPHGGYSLDDDACAGCHRAHTSFSEVTWDQDPDGAGGVAGVQRSALLISSATTMEEFCYACHGEGAPGASTNVEMGIFDSGPSGEDGEVAGGAIFYETNSSYDATLNGGGFTEVGGVAATSMHNMEDGAATDPMWGSAATLPSGQNLTCTDCHDPHGSSNYRLLKDQVNGIPVGGYAADGTPQPYVFSSEENYPGAGWYKHDAGAAQMSLYKPNYTSAEYKYMDPEIDYSGTSPRSMSTWCSSCHTAYNNKPDFAAALAAAPISYGVAEQDTDSPEQVGARVRHRHPVDVPISSVTQANGWGSDAITSTVLPLADASDAGDVRGVWSSSDYLDCLTCHRAHGTAATMSGWANARLANRAVPAGRNDSWTVEPYIGAPAGVNPNFTSALLRTDNRGVCERCHNK